MLQLSGILIRKPIIFSNLIKSTQVICISTGCRRYFAQKVSTPFVSRPNLGQRDESKKISPLGYFLILVPITTFGLGCWQIKRKIWKENLLKELKEKTVTAPVDIPENLEELNKMEYRSVRVRGEFQHDKEMLLGPRSFIRPDGAEMGGGLFSTRDSSNGYLVVTPFKLVGRDETILINRGWVSRKFVKPETRKEGQVSGEVELCGVVRMGEMRPQFTPDHKGGVYLYRDLPRMCSATGALPYILDADYASTVQHGPVGGQTRVTLRNEHLSYIVTWFSLSGATAWLWYRQIIKRKAF
ncbi:SURF1-like protein [Episyrphus balteatus]|uniref:SURF1-like protein n=1 Tax=Episyrphus balteatus TaxID=286459 RepID=UPI002486642C|nr:SURF1-like protein [Episyrphus balteatus]